MSVLKQVFHGMANGTIVLEKARAGGLTTTIHDVRSKLSQPLPLDDCKGVVAEVGKKGEGFQPADGTISNGPQADALKVSRNLCPKAACGVSDEAASFVVVASIDLQSIHLAQPTLGEAFLAIGGGLISLLTLQLRHTHGCRDLAINFDESKRKLGAPTCNPDQEEDPFAAEVACSHGQGVNGVIVAASTALSYPVTQGASISRKRGLIVSVSVAVEVFASGGVLQLDNFRKLTGFGWPGFKRMNLWRQDKGQNAGAAAFLRSITEGRPAIEPEEIFEVARVSIEVAEQVRRQ